MRILYATDGRPPATAAGELISRLAEPGSSNVTILHAAEFGNEAVEARYGEQVVSGASDAMETAGLATEVVTCGESPIACIDRELATRAYGLAVVGAGNHPWLDRLVFGSVSSHLLHEGVAPVLVVHRAPDPDRRAVRVLVGADGSPSVAAAIETLKAVTTPARIEAHAISVVEPFAPAIAVHPGGADLEPLASEVLERRQADARHHLDAAVEALAEGGFRADGSIAQGPAATEILEAAGRTGADLVVVGARGLGALARITVGSVSAHVARHAPATLVARDRGAGPA